MPKERLSPGEIEKANRDYLGHIETMQDICDYSEANHRFVGGTLTDFLNPRTRAEFDFDRNIVYLSDCTTPQMYRSDGTEKDADLISFCEDPLRFKRVKRELEDLEESFEHRKLPFPHVSIEPTRFPTFAPANKALQLTSGFEVDKNGDLFLTFDRIRQKTDWDTVEPWDVILTGENGVFFTTLNPFAHALRYLMRVPSGMKKKDRDIKEQDGVMFNKMSPFVKLALDFAQEAETHDIDMAELYEPWIEFIMKMRYDKNLRMRAKRLATGAWWDTVGTAFAHGRGVLAPFAQFGDRFSG